MPEDEQLATKVTFDFNNGDMQTVVEVASGAIDHETGRFSDAVWGITRVEVYSKTPVRPEFFEPFFAAAAQMVMTGGIPILIALHDAEATT